MKKVYTDYEGNIIIEKYWVAGEYGGYFKTMKEARQACKLQSIEYGESEIYHTDDYCWYVKYVNGKEVK